jgi:hypothetical protein
LVRTCCENGPNAIAKNYDQLETWSNEKLRSPKNLERWDIHVYSSEWKRSQNGRVEQSKAMKCGGRKASPDVLKPPIYRWPQKTGTFEMRSGSNVQLAALRTRDLELQTTSPFSNHGSVERSTACCRHKNVLHAWIFQKFPFFGVILYMHSE